MMTPFKKRAVDDLMFLLNRLNNSNFDIDRNKDGYVTSINKSGKKLHRAVIEERLESFIDNIIKEARLQIEKNR